MTQAGSPFFAGDAYWSVVATWGAARNPVQPSGALSVLPYHAYVPSFGAWGFVIASPHAPARRPLQLPSGLRYLTGAVWDQAQVFPTDTARRDVAVNTLRSHALVRYYQDGWATWFD